MYIYFFLHVFIHLRDSYFYIYIYKQRHDQRAITYNNINKDNRSFNPISNLTAIKIHWSKEGIFTVKTC